MAAAAPADLYSNEVYRRQLTANDKKERSRLYIYKSPALYICPEAFDPPEGEGPYTRDLPFFDTSFKPLPMVFLRRDKKCYLTGGWGDFVRANNLGPGDVVIIHELKHKSGTGERFFMIGRVEVMGVLIG